MPTQIHQWEDLRRRFTGTIILGNGASIAVSNAFRYDSLRQYAIDHDLFDNDIQSLFNFFDTTDFELILRTVWQATNVNNCLQIPDERTQQAYLHVRNCLIQTVREIHPEYNSVSQHLPHIFTFLSNFHTIISLNYDLIVYWALMYGQSIDSRHVLKDCFYSGDFSTDWRAYRTPIYNQESCGLVFYPHGNLILARNRTETEFKIDARSSANLLEQILHNWETGNCVPLFVSEGNCEQKINSIRNSNYLSTVYKEVLPSSSNRITVYGWGFGEQDFHILTALRRAQIREIAISVFRQDERFCARATEAVHRILGDTVEVVFFDSESPGCWRSPEP